MRSSNRSVSRHAGLAVLAIAVSIVTLACGSSASPSPPPTGAPPTPVITPDPHLSAPASVDAVFSALGSSGLQITANTASKGPGGEPEKLINATYAGWPLILSQFSTADALRKVTKFDPRVAPTHGDAPYAIVGLNILVEFGPKTSTLKTPVLPDAHRQAAALVLVAALDRLLGPLAERSVMPLALPGASVAPATSPTPAASAAAS